MSPLLDRNHIYGGVDLFFRKETNTKYHIDIFACMYQIAGMCGCNFVNGGTLKLFTPQLRSANHPRYVTRKLRSSKQDAHGAILLGT